MSDFYPLGQSCIHCGKMLEACEKPTSGVSIVGLRNLEYRHTDGTTECVIIKRPCAWDGWSATRAFEAARRKSWAEHDARISN